MKKYLFVLIITIFFLGCIGNSSETEESSIKHAEELKKQSMFSVYASELFATMGLGNAETYEPVEPEKIGEFEKFN